MLRRLRPTTESRRGTHRLLGSSACASRCCSAAGLAIGVQQHYRQHLKVAAAAEEQRDFVPRVRALQSRPVPIFTRWFRRPRPPLLKRPTSLPGQAGTSCSAMSISALASRRATCLPVISAPELDHQIAQAQATLAQNEATLRQTEANRELAAHNWGRDAVPVRHGWATQQQGDTDRLEPRGADGRRPTQITHHQGQQAQIEVLQQQKAYQRVVAPFDGVITQRNIDVGSLVQADATSGTFMFAIAHGNIMRIQLFVPQEAAVGVKPGVTAIVRVAEIPGTDFRPRLLASPTPWTRGREPC